MLYFFSKAEFGFRLYNFLNISERQPIPKQ
jgi:hypothetical protein